MSPTVCVNSSMSLVDVRKMFANQTAGVLLNIGFSLAKRLRLDPLKLA